MRIRFVIAGCFLLWAGCALGQETSANSDTESSKSKPGLSLSLPFSVVKTDMVYPGITDEQIGTAIDQAAGYIIGQFNGGELGKGGDERASDHFGLNDLCVYALLAASQSSHDPRLDIHGPFLKQLIEAMKAQSIVADRDAATNPDRPIPGTPAVYARSIRATALAVYNRPEDRAVLKADVAWLIAASRAGAYTYDDRWGPMEEPDALPNPRRSDQVIVDFPWDNSNSQYGVLGVWAGAEAGIEVPDRYWKAVQQHWESCQISNGQWYYRNNDRAPRYSMTCGGVSSLYITHDYLDAMVGRVGKTPYSKSLTRGIDWLETADNSVAPAEGGGFYAGYNFYGLERVGLISGYKFFGTHDWYRELAPLVLARQTMEGGIRRYAQERDNLIETAFDLLFLARGRHPILMNKLRFDGMWAAHPRDVANLARFASHELERPINWQIVSLGADYTQWLDAPILYIASNQAVKFTDKDIANIRNYVLAGGMLFTQADNGSAAANASILALGTKLFSSYEFTDLPADHELYTCNYQIKTPRPKLRIMSNGSRILWVHSPTDIALAWQTRAEKSRRSLFELGVNLFVFAAGKQDLRNRLSTAVYPVFDKPIGGTIRVARVKYAGQWDPEPVAWERFGTFMKWETGLAVDAAPVAATDLNVAQYPLAHVAGTFASTISDDDLKAIRAYVESGGVLLLEATGGSAAFNDSLEKSWLPVLTSGTEMKGMPSDHPLLLASANGMTDVTHFSLRPKTSQKMGPSLHLKIAQVGKGLVIYSALDLSSSLLSANTWSIMGYTPAYSQSLMKNIVLYSVAHREGMQ